ncbi:MAG: FAD binding domain-containing protein [Acetobacteraceae bacterium]
MKALIAGGSLAGLFAACLLRRAGWEVEVFERAPVRLSGRGAGIVTHRPLFEALAAAGCDLGREIGVRVPGRVAFGRAGEAVVERSMPQVLTSWSRLYSLLDAVGPAVRRGWSLEAYAADATGVVARFAGGREARGDLLIGADGLRSAVRRQMLPEVRAAYAGYIAWRGVTAEAALSAATHAALFERFAFSLPDGEQMLGYPIAGDEDDTRPGHRRYNFVWYRPVGPEALAGMQVAADGAAYPDGIPPGLIRPELIRAMRADAERVLSPQFAEVVRDCAAPFFQPILDLDAPTMASGRVALMGDAAFVARPHVGMGVTKAAEDAVALAACLAEAGPEAGLAAYDARRRPACAAVVQRARDLGAYMQAQRHSAAERAAAARHRTPAAVLAETAWMEEA